MTIQTEKVELNLLLIDDDSVCNFITRTLLNQKGFSNVAAVENGREAMDYLSKNKQPDLIFLDLNMPIMDGFDFLEQLMDSTICPDTRILILTSSTRAEDIQVATSFGNVIGYHEKPLTEKKVREIIEKLFQ